MKTKELLQEILQKMGKWNCREKILLISVVCSFMAISCNQSSQLQVVSPESVGLSTERLNRIDTMLNQSINSNWITGAVPLIQRNGKIVYYKAFGMDDKEEHIPMKRDGIFRIASQTKAVTSVAVMMLFEEGKLLLDDPISKYIPEFAHPRLVDQFNEEDTTYTTIPANREITIRDLLTHTS
ncbi:MAG: beta-lactamase family protein, partial [Bacteroidales bacterium]|nr:beta-lactamase family protein [Bacteroidales bacterium]